MNECKACRVGDAIGKTLSVRLFTWFSYTRSSIHVNLVKLGSIENSPTASPDYFFLVPWKLLLSPRFRLITGTSNFRDEFPLSSSLVRSCWFQVRMHGYSWLSITVVDFILVLCSFFFRYIYTFTDKTKVKKHNRLKITVYFLSSQIHCLELKIPQRGNSPYMNMQSILMLDI